MNVYRKSKGNAGLDGVQFQVSLLTVVLLNAYRKLKKWKLSSENEDAAKFDDLILELSDTSAILLQAKFKCRKKINKEQLLSNNSKTADFSLAKYFFSYQEIKEKFNVKSIIVCTNTDVNQKALESVLMRCCIDQDSMLYHGNDNCPVFTFNENILPDLKTNAEVYLKNNLQNKGINESIITEENLKEFLKHLQLIFSYPSGEHLLKIIGQLLSRLDDSNLVAKISSQEVYKKVEDWFKQSRGEYFTEIRVEAMLFEIKSDKYIESLRDYNVSFEHNNLNFTDLKRIYHITTEGGHLLQVLKVDQALQKYKSKNIYIEIDDCIELLEQVINVFELPCYTHLIVTWAKFNETSLIECVNIKLKEILEKYQYKKVIFVAQSDNKLPRHVGLDRNYFDIVQESVTLEDLSREAKEIILSTRNILFQGRRINLTELLPTQTTQDYGSTIDSEILEQFLRREEIKVGTPISDLDEHVHRYYIPRTIKRTFKKYLEENWNKEGGEDFEQSTEVYQNGNFKIGLTKTRDGITKSERKEEIIPENSIYDVKDKLVLIADIAGMGKSTILTKLAMTVKNHNSRLWVIKVELNDYTRILRDSVRNGKTTINVTELLASRVITKFTNRLEKYVFTVNEKIVLMLDGIDEISPDYTQLIVSLLQQCLKETNFAKIFITSRSHMVKELKKVLKVKPFILQPFTKQNQLDFLTSYWAHNLKLKDNTNKEKCMRYAEAIINNISWTHLKNNIENHLASVPLHLRMIAEIFQESTRLNKLTDWGGCNDYVFGDEDAELKLTNRMNVTNLYDLFIEKKRDIFIDKGNPTGNAAANQALIEQFKECLVYHQNLALEIIVGEENFNCFASYRQRDKNMETNVLKIGIVRTLNNKLHFVHRTFGDYFVAKCLLVELQQNTSSEFQIFLIDTIFLQPQYNTARIFFDSLIQNIVNTLPSNIFEKYHSIKQESTLKLFKMQSELIHILAGSNCIQILQLILNCIDFKSIANKEVNTTDFYDYSFDKNAPEIFGNALNVLQHFTGHAGMNIKDEQGWTPLHCAAQNGHLEMVKYLIKQGANIHSRTNNGYTVCYTATLGNLRTLQYLVSLGADLNIRDIENYTILHAAAQNCQIDIIKFLIDCGLKINVTSNDDFTLLHAASEKGNLDAIKFLLELGMDSNIKDSNGFTALLSAAQHGQLNIVKFFVGYGLDVKDTTSHGSTLVHLASANGHLETVKYLLGLGLDCSIKDKSGFTALLSAAQYGQLNIVKLFVESGLDIKDTNSYGSTLLHLASANGHLETVKYLLDVGIDSNIKDSGGFTALHEAVRYGQSSIVKFLVENRLQLGLDWSIKSNYGFTVLLLAAQCGQLNIVKLFVEYGLDVKYTTSNGSTLLHLASANGHLETVKYLLGLGADSNIKDNNGFTAIHAAIRYGQSSTVKFLLEYGPEFGLDWSIKDNDGLSVLHVAAQCGLLNIVKLIVECGLDVKDTDNYGATMLHLASADGHLETIKYLLEIGVDSNIKDNDGFTALHVAAQYGQLETVKLFVENGVDFNITSKSDCTLLHIASEYCHFDIVKFVCELGIDINAADNNSFTALQTAVCFGNLQIVKHLVEHGAYYKFTNRYGRTLLHFASEYGHLEILRYLLELGVDFNVKDHDGFSALHLAAQYGQLDTVKFLIVYGLDVNTASSYGYSPLHLASENGHLDTVKVLVERGANSNITDEDGFTVLQTAVYFGQLDIVKFLVDNASNINVKSKYGSTLLHSAAENGDLDVMKFLIERGMDCNIRDYCGNTALHLAARSNHLDTMKFLIQRGACIHIKNYRGITALQLASDYVQWNTAEFLKKQEADI